jgi:hypothetical protein
MTLEGSVGASALCARGSARSAVWPVAVLFGATLAAAASSGAWIAARPGALGRPWTLLEWTAEHALWGAFLGIALAVVVRHGARFDPWLRDAGRRRAAGARLSAVCVAALGLALTMKLAAASEQAWPNALRSLVGASLGFAACWLLLVRGIVRTPRFASLPELDPARVAVAVALLTLPLASNSARELPKAAAAALALPISSHAAPPSTLVDAWRRLLEP